MIQKRCVVMFVKYPEKGEVKSRLTKYLDEDFVVNLYKNFVVDLLETLEKGDYKFKIAFYPIEKRFKIIQQFGNGYSYLPQIGADLGGKMKNAFSQCFSEGFRKVMIIGSDSPDLTNQIIEEAFNSLENHDVVIGPSLDGGYYLIGFKKETFYPEVFKGISWSTETVFENTMKILSKKGYEVCVLPKWRDVDRPEDLKELIKRNEKTRFANSRTISYLLSVSKFLS